MILYNKNDIYNTNIVVGAIFISLIRYIAQENINRRVTIHFDGKFLDAWLNIVTDNTKKIHIIAWQIQNEILELYNCSLKKNILNTNDSQEKLSKSKQLLQEKYDTIEAMEDRVSKWHDHFNKLLGEGQEHETSSIRIKTISESTFVIQTEPFTNEEYNKVKENLIDGNAAGPDGIAPEILKYGNFDDFMLGCTNKIYLEYTHTTRNTIAMAKMQHCSISQIR